MLRARPASEWYAREGDIVSYQGRDPEDMPHTIANEAALRSVLENREADLQRLH